MTEGRTRQERKPVQQPVVGLALDPPKAHIPDVGEARAELAAQKSKESKAYVAIY
jgi:hypothetical protein